MALRCVSLELPGPVSNNLPAHRLFSDSLAIIRTTKPSPAVTLAQVGEMSEGAATRGTDPGDCLGHSEPTASLSIVSDRHPAEHLVCSSTSQLHSGKNCQLV